MFDHTHVEGIKKVTCRRKGLCSPHKVAEEAKTEATIYDITSVIALSYKDISWTFRGAGT